MRKLTLKLVRSRGLSDSLEVAPLPDRAQDLRESVSLESQSARLSSAGLASMRVARVFTGKSLSFHLDLLC